jgi:hypothetical protein
MLLANSDSSVAYIYRKRADGWEYRARLPYPAGYRQPCGADLHADIALICADDGNGGPSSVLVFQRNADNWSLLQTLPGGLTISDGKTIAITTPDVVSLYERTRSRLQLRAQIPAPEPERGFGSSLALDDSTLMVGSPYAGPNYQGTVYVYERRHGVWQLEQQLSASDPQNSFGSRVGLQGRIAVVGAQFADQDENAPVATVVGAAYVFAKENGNWHEQQKLSNPTNGSFAYAVVGTDGRRLFISSHYIRPHDDDPESLANEAKVFVYARHAGEWTIQRELVPPTTSNNFALNFSIDGCSFLTADAYVATADPLFDGEAYLYEMRGGCRD